MQKELRRYRVVSNGHTFRVQCIHKRQVGFWFRRRYVDEWDIIGSFKFPENGVVPIWSASEFKTAEEAAAKIKELRDYEDNLHDWKPV